MCSSDLARHLAGVGDMSLDAQARVRGAREGGVVTRVGGSRAITVDMRVFAATNKELLKEITEGRFREDFYYRLNVVPIVVPPLCERREDIQPLVRHFVSRAVGSNHGPLKTIEDGAMERLEALDWPGNEIGRAHA